MAVALSGALYVVESLIPFPIPVGRWGMSNSVVLFSAVNWGLKASLVVASAKSILGSILTGRFLTPTFFMGFAGSVAAGFVEWIVSKFGLGYIGVSLAGSSVNNVVQVLIGAMLIKSLSIFDLLPLFLIFGSLSAVVNAYIASVYEKVWRDIL